MPTYQADIPYKWEPEQEFTFKGLEFASLYHLLHTEMHNPSGANIAIKVESYNAIMRVFKEGVEKGIIVENKDGEEAPGNLDPNLDNKLFN